MRMASFGDIIIVLFVLERFAQWCFPRMKNETPFRLKIEQPFAFPRFIP